MGTSSPRIAAAQIILGKFSNSSHYLVSCLMCKCAHSLTHSLSHSFTHLPTHSLTLSLSLTHSFTYPLTHSLTLSLTHSLTHLPTHSLTLSLSLSLSLTHSLIHLPTHSLTHSLTYPLTHSLSLSLSLTHSFTYPLTHSPTHSLIHSPTHSLTHSLSLSHSLTHSPTHSLTHPLTHSFTYHSLSLSSSLSLGCSSPMDVSSLSSGGQLLLFSAGALSYGLLSEVAVLSRDFTWLGSRRVEIAQVRALWSKRLAQEDDTLCIMLTQYALPLARCFWTHDSKFSCCCIR